MKVISVKSQDELKHVFDIRRTVFVEEQGVAAELEFDAHESLAEHVLAYWEGQPAGAGRLREVDGVAKLERICVLADYRKFGIGKHIIRFLERLASERGLAKAKLHGQTHAEGFYLKLGYTTDSPVFMEDGIPHVRMIKTLAPTSELGGE